MSKGVRVSGGRYRGRRLVVPEGVRPTSARTREALFSIWAEELTQGPFLDLFAGSALVGVEALGRGAPRVVGLELSSRVIREAEAQLERLGVDELELRRARLPQGFERAVRRTEEFHLIFIDPPYRLVGLEPLLELAQTRLRPDGALALEQSVRNPEIAEVGELVCTERRTYGETCVSFFHRRG